MPTDYSKSLIYQIKCKDPSITKMYIGSTVDHYQRNATHKSRCINPTDEFHNLKVYIFIREHGSGWDNWEMVELYKYPCNSLKELIAEEGRASDNYNSELNKNKPGRSKPEYDRDHSEERKEYLNGKSKEWYAENRETAQEGARERYYARQEELNTQTPCECGVSIAKQNLTRHRTTPTHKKRMECLAEGKEIVVTKKRKKTECKCGAVVTNLNRMFLMGGGRRCHI